jgi:asparagine synthase (glutamine-hydrolysing)
VDDARVTTDRFWRAGEFYPTSALTLDDAVDEFRTLFTEAVTSALDADGETWSQLSGGLDSSSVFATAQTLYRQGKVARGIAGTVTIADSLASGDEREFSDEMLRRYPTRNECIVDYWPWREDEWTLPLSDQPWLFYPYYARDRRMCDFVRESGSRVLLSGYGSDNYLSGNCGFITDLVARGHLARAVRELAVWSSATQSSFWRMAYDHGIQPLLPQSIRRLLLRPERGIPVWLNPSFVEQYGVARTRRQLRRYETYSVGFWSGETAWQVDGMSSFIERDTFADGLEVRYPFLYRPLVEFALRLPPGLVAQPRATKYVLRESMRGFVPERVRTRTGKGSLGARVRWAMSQERRTVNALATDSMLADLGCINPGVLRSIVSQIRRGRGRTIITPFAALSLETWLRVRSGQWPPPHRDLAPRRESTVALENTVPLPPLETQHAFVQHADPD